MTAGVNRLRPLLAAHLPDYGSADIRCLGTGVDHVAYLVGGEILVRLARNPAVGESAGGESADDEPVARTPAGDEPAARTPAHREPAHDEPANGGEEDPQQTAGDHPRDETEREARLLRVIARYSTLPVPVPLAVADGMLAYRALPGVPVLSRSQDWRRARSAVLGNILGRFLASLRSIPADALSGIAEVDSQPPAAWLTDAQECWASVGTWAATALPNGSHGMVDRFLATPPPPHGDEVCFTHNDLGAEHVLVDPESGEVTGVIDWTDAAITDPAVDLGLLLRDLGDGAFRAAARHLTDARHRAGSCRASGDPTVSDPAGLRDRAVFYARCRLLEDVRFGIENDSPEYVTNSVAAAEWLFAG